MPQTKQSDQPDADAAAKDQWVARTLGVVISGAAEGSPDNVQAAERLFELLQQWRRAEQQALVGLRQLGDNVLRDPEVKDSPVAAEVGTMIPELSGLIPVFSDRLSDALNHVRDAQTEADRARARAVVQAAISAYRSGLEQEDRLPDLEELGVMLFGQKPFYSPLLRLLGDFERAVAV
jgi:hypothetical protein